MLIPRRVLLAGGPFGGELSGRELPGGELSAARVTESIARGLRAGGLAEVDLCPLPAEDGDLQAAREWLEAVDFDSRMRGARAVVVADERLREQTLAASLTFEIATRARQSGVPAYAVTAEDRLDAFDARILDLQVVLEAGSGRALAAAGRALASLL